MLVQVVNRNIQFSQKGKLATAFENVVEVWNGKFVLKMKIIRAQLWCSEPWNPEKCEKPYASHTIPTQIRSISFCPFEDVLGIGSKQGFSSILVPGAGEPNPDSYSFNPFQTKKQRGRTEVRMLLEKCPPETIALDPTLLAKLDQEKVEGMPKYRAPKKFENSYLWIIFRVWRRKTEASWI